MKHLLLHQSVYEIDHCTAFGPCSTRRITNKQKLKVWLHNPTVYPVLYQTVCGYAEGAKNALGLGWNERNTQKMMPVAFTKEPDGRKLS